MFYDTLKALCDERNISPSKAAAECGISRSTVTWWKQHKTNPNSEQVSKLANYFNVSIDYLLGNKQKETPALTKKDERDISKRLDQTLSDLENAQGALMFDGEPLDDVTKELLIASLRKDLEMGKRIAKQKFTPKKYRKPE